MSTPDLCAEWARTGFNCREFTDVVRANGERAELLAALKQIADSEEECGCEHTTQDCCNKVGVFCARCIAAAAIVKAEQGSR